MRIPQTQSDFNPGLSGTSDSIGYRTAEVEKHLHNRGFWRGKQNPQTATDWAADVINNAFRAISGNNAYGTDLNDEALVVGTADTPVLSGYVKYDMHKILITDASSTSIYKLRIVYGSGTMAAAIAANQFSEFVTRVDAATGQLPMVSHEVMMPRVNCGVDKIWIQAWNATDNATIDFYVGWHEYSG